MTDARTAKPAKWIVFCQRGDSLISKFVATCQIAKPTANMANDHWIVVLPCELRVNHLSLDRYSIASFFSDGNIKWLNKMRPEEI